MSYHLSNIEFFEKTFRQHYSLLVNFANTFLHDINDSEEVVQQTFVKIWENKENINIQNSIKSYLFTSVRNSCMNHLKHEKVVNHYKAYNKEIRDFEEHKTVINFESIEMFETIQNAIKKLPEERKKIFLLSRNEGLKYSEIAEKLQISPKTVENQMSSALKFLRIELKDYLLLLIIFIKTMFFK